MQKYNPFHNLRRSSSENVVERFRYVRRESSARSRVVRLDEARDLTKGLFEESELFESGSVAAGILMWVVSSFARKRRAVRFLEADRELLNRVSLA